MTNIKYESNKWTKSQIKTNIVYFIFPELNKQSAIKCKILPINYNMLSRRLTVGSENSIVNDETYQDIPKSFKLFPFNWTKLDNSEPKSESGATHKNQKVNRLFARTYPACGEFDSCLFRNITSLCAG